VRKPRHNLTPAEEADLDAALAMSLDLVTKALMRKYNVSRTVIDRRKKIIRSKKQNAFIAIHVEKVSADTLDR
jgi:hypothetical protein